MSPEQEFLRNMVRGAYDLQKLRIQTGNRLVANFRSKLGIKKDEKLDDQQTQNLLAVLKKELQEGTPNELQNRWVSGSQIFSGHFPGNRACTERSLSYHAGNG
jgi:hypothetical protein